jgi:hypothetical protein
MHLYVAREYLSWDGGFVMHPIVEPLKGDRASPHPVSRRALLEGSASAGLVAAAARLGRCRAPFGRCERSRRLAAPDGDLPHASGGGAGISRRAAAVPSVERRRSALRRQQALGLLRDYSRTYNERFDGFVVRKFNGEKVKIASGAVRPL